MYKLLFYIIFSFYISIIIIGNNDLYAIEEPSTSVDNDDEVIAFNLPEEYRELIKQKKNGNAKQEFRIKDIVQIEGMRNNILIGYGLVVGLNSTGDQLKNSSFTQQGLESLLGSLGVNANGASVKTRSIASVAVTADLPPFASNGMSIDIKVSSIGDALSLENGTLIATPLMAANGQVYAIAQGSISVPSSGNPKNQKNRKNISKTTGFITNGATVEREIGFNYSDMKKVKLILHNPDMKTAYNIANIINNDFQSEDIALSPDSTNVVLNIPNEYRNGKEVSFFKRIGELKVEVDDIAKIIIDRNLGTIIIGKNVKIMPVAISQNDLSISIGEDVATLENGYKTLQDLVDGLNAVNVGTSEISDILHNLRQAGVIQANIIVK